MAAKVKPSRLESEIEKSRGECNWKKALEFSKQLAQKSVGLENLINFITGESKLEEYLQDNVPTEKNISKAKGQLSEAEIYLNRIVQVENKFKIEAQLLLAKIQYCKGIYQGCLALLDKAGIDSITAKGSSCRFLQILAESYAIKGLCIERIAPATTSKYKAAEKEEKIMHYFEKAGDLAVLYLQEREKLLSVNILSLNVSSNDSMGLILETVIQQSPLLHIKHGKLMQGIGRFRELLRSVETRFTQNLRQVLARQLAEVLLRGMCHKTYIPLDVQENTQDSLDVLQPRKYAGERLFVPRDADEEALLLLLIAEAIATREVVLNRSEEHTEVRVHTFQNVAAVHDLLAIALVKRAQFNLLAESYERAMRFSYDEFHIWYQFANSLISTGKYSRAVLVLKECAKYQPMNPSVSLQAARLCLEFLHQYDDGIQFAEKALAVGEGHPMSSRCYVALGVGYSMKAMDMKRQEDRQNLHNKALSAFQKAQVLDPNDCIAAFHLALQLAILRQIPEAVTYVKIALNHRSDHIHSLHLLVLLLSAQKQYEEAMVFLGTALHEHPDNISLLLTKAKLEEVCVGPEEALVTCKDLLKIWKDLHEIQVEDCESQVKAPIADRTTFDRRSLVQLHLNELSERDSGSIRAESVAASRVEQALSEVASSLNSSFHPRPGSQQIWLLQAQIWLHLAELYLSLERIQEAESCVHETATIFPLSYQVAFMKGRINEHKKKYFEAKACFENAVSINPGHIKSLHHLGTVLHNLGNNRMAEKVLRDAVNADPSSHQSWYYLGQVLDALSQYESAANCLQFSIDLEATSPVIPFTVIPRLLQ